ncbi:MFS transporter [Candidatus Hodarchaeum mangrovi]
MSHTTETVNKPRKVNFNGWYLSNAIDSASKASVDQFLPIFATQLGASTSIVGWLSGLYSLVNIFQIVWASISVRVKRTSIFVVTGRFFSAIFYIPMAFLGVGQAFLLLIFRFFQGIFFSAVAPTQASLMADHIPSSKRAQRVNRITQGNLIGTLIGAMLGGFIFTLLSDDFKLDPQISFLILFFWTAFLGILTAAIFQRSVPDADNLYKIDPIIFINQNLTVHAKPSRLNFIEKISAYFEKFKTFWVFTVFVAFFYFAVNVSSPFFIILEIEYYHFSFFQASILTSLTTVVQFFVNLVIVKYNILDHFGRKFPLFCGILCLIFSTLLIIIPYYFSVPTFNWCFLAWIILGLGWGIFNSALTVMVLDLVHPQYRTTLIAVYNTFVGLTMFISPILGGFIIEFFLNITIIFLIRSVLMIFSIFLLVYVKEPEIPGMITHPIKYLYTKVFRTTPEGDSTVVVSPTHSIKSRFPHWIADRRHYKLER